MLPDRTFWTCTKLRNRKGMDGRRQVYSEMEAILVSSLCTSGAHAPAWDFDFPAELEPMPTTDAIRLVLQCPFHLPPGPWVELAEKLQVLGLAKNLAVARWEGEVEAVSKVMMDVVVGIQIVKSSDPHHRHVYLDKEIPWTSYATLLELMKGCGLLEVGFVDNSIQRRMTMLLKPGLKKEHLAALGVELEEGSDGKAAAPEITKEPEKEVEF